MSNSEDYESLKYMEQFLHKKEANGKWIEFWVICRGNYLLFYSHRCETTELRDAFRGFIELTIGTRCLVSKRKKYNFPFYLCTSKAKYYFKCPTLLLRHQWIHAIDLAIKREYPQKAPTTLPSPESTRKQNDIEDEEDSCLDQNTSNDSTDSPVNDSSETEVDHDLHTSDLPRRNIIIVTSRPTDSNQVTNFTGEDVSPDTSNFSVTNFLAARSESSTNNERNGIDNLSYEEDSIQPVNSEKVSTSFAQGSNAGSRPGSVSPVIPFRFHPSSSPVSHISDHWVSGRVTRSADSHRGSAMRLMGSTDRISSSSYLSVRPTISGLSVNTSRFSRHLISSAPDLKAVANQV